MLTPEEFLASGDYLVRTCPTWSWCGAACAAPLLAGRLQLHLLCHINASPVRLPCYILLLLPCSWAAISRDGFMRSSSACELLANVPLTML